jgi:von Willebrand factor type A domain
MTRISCSVLFGLTLSLVPMAVWAQTCNTADRSVLLILDASGSMNAKLPNGETRIEVARRAVKGVASLVPAQTQLSLRLYGAQSPASQKNCQDTHLAAPFGPASANGGVITTTVDGAKAQGYTPIAYSLGQAANDFPADAKERVIVLVSDGKETCQGDPVVTARALAGKNITVHAVGFVVDTAARGQLQAIARATGGSYFDAPVGPELPDTLKSALGACKKTVAKAPAKTQPGKLRTTSATWLASHAVHNAETGQQVGTLDSAKLELALPAGIYEVKFGPGSWKGIEVRSGETTTIEPGVLKLTPNASAAVVDSETGEKHGSFDAMSSSVTLMPGVYDLRFGKTDWRFIKVDGGKTTTLKPVKVVLARDLKWQKARVTTQDGKEVARFDAMTYQAALPPGDYIVEVDGKKFPFPATEGEVFEVKAQ